MSHSTATTPAVRLRSAASFFVVFLFGAASSALAQMTIPYIADVSFDGQRDPNVLAAALEVQVSGAHGDATVFLAHDGIALFCAFEGALQNSFQFPEVLIDANGSGTGFWEDDDIWVHVSGRDCSSIGEHSNYDDCQLEREDWYGMPNFTQGGPAVNYLEIYLPFDFLGIDPLGVFALAFDVTNTAGSYSYWPAGASIADPSTWADVQLEAVTTDVGPDRNQLAGLGLRAWIDAQATVQYELTGPQPGVYTIQVFDVQGRSLAVQRLAAFEAAGGAHLRGQLPLSTQYAPGGPAAGVYLLHVKSQTGALLTQTLQYLP